MGGGTHVLKVFWSKLELGSKLLRHNFQKRIVEANGRLERARSGRLNAKTALSRWCAKIRIAERVERVQPMCTEPGMASIRPRGRERRRSARAALRQSVRSPKYVQKRKNQVPAPHHCSPPRRRVPEAQWSISSSASPALEKFMISQRVGF